ncbi:MAG: allophanate hydrolase [Leptolyngbyaceae cyanobacterium MO_188.B28]|nr:allophanate hydrolase [Leptolyngbyaceae cyanobacterium MO_188.B28]
MIDQTGLGVALTLSSLQKQYSTGELSLQQVIESIVADLECRGDDGIWIYRVSKQALLERAAILTQMNPRQREQLPLWGVPFSVKDCIDVAGLLTSAGCPGFVYEATHTNPVVQKLLAAGAILIGKTNLDQFATGLVGVRTGYTVPHNAFSTEYISGGSSSGSALSVAMGQVSFSIGTDTGGSGRVPAGFNNIVGLKPTRGLLSTSRTVEACKTLDCLSIFTLTAEDAQTVFEVAQGFDPTNPFSRPMGQPLERLKAYSANQSFRFGVPRPDQRAFFGNTDCEALYEKANATLIQLGGLCVEIDYGPFLEANDLLFNGPWVAERYASVGKFVETNPAAVFPITREIILKAKTLTAAEAFEGLYAVEAFKRMIQPLWDDIDCLVTPTTGTIYRIDEIEAEPLRLNANLGYYTNFVNLLDLSAIAIPNGFQSNGIPSGVTFISPPHSETYLAGLGAAFHRACNEQLGATSFKVGDIARGLSVGV